MKRRAIAVLTASLLPLLAACGAASELSEPEAAGKVTVIGEFGKAPTVTWTKDFAAGKLKVKELVKGTGEVVTPATKSVDVNYWIASAEGTPEQAQSSFGAKDAAPTPVAIPYDKKQGFPVFNAVYDGKYTLGSRLLITGWAQNAFGEEGNPNAGIGRNDTAVAVIDLVKKSPEPPKPQPAPTAPVDKVAKVTDVERKLLPKLVVDPKDRDKVTGMTWDGIKPLDNNGDIQRAYIKKGTGAKLTATSKAKVRYAGSIYQGEALFDSSWSGPQGGKPFDVDMSGGVVQGWLDGLKGVPVGSRIVLGIPSRYGYGEQGSGEDIPANAPLYFYVEVISAS